MRSINIKKLSLALCCLAMLISASSAHGASYTVDTTVSSETIKNLRMIETNGLADGVCRYFSLVRYGMQIMLGTFLVVMAVKALFDGGKTFSVGLFINIMAAGIFFNVAAGLFTLFLPNLDISNGCKCKPYIKTGFVMNNGVFQHVIVPSGLDSSCNDLLGT